MNARIPLNESLHFNLVTSTMSCTYYNHFIPGNACVFNYTV